MSASTVIQMEKYQEADGLITFTHLLEFPMFPMGSRESQSKGRFATVFESCMLGWDVSIRKKFHGRSVTGRGTFWEIGLHGVTSRDIYPPVHRLLFTVRLLNRDTRRILQTLKYSIDGQTSLSHPPTSSRLQGGLQRAAEGKCYVTDANSSFAKMLRDLMERPPSRDTSRVIRLETHIEFQKACLCDARFLVGIEAPEVGVASGGSYFFDALTNPARHDLTLKTANGREALTTNKEVLCLASSYFRSHLKEHTREFVVQRAELLDSIDIALTYTVTGHYKKPAQMSAQLATEVLALCSMWHSFQPKHVRNAVEKHCFEELKTRHEDFGHVLQLLVAAEDAALAGLQSSCVATLHFYHFATFNRHFIVPTGRHPLRERFSVRREFMKPSLTMQVKKCFAASNEVKSFVKFIPEVGCD